MRSRCIVIALFSLFMLSACGGGGGGGSDGLPDSTNGTPTGGNGGNTGNDGGNTGGGGGTGGGGTGSPPISGTGGGGTGGAPRMSVCGTTESYCHTIEKQLNAAAAAGNLTALDAVWDQIRRALHDSVGFGRNPIPDHDFYRLPVPQQQALINLYIQHESTLNPSAQIRPSAPAPTLIIPATGYYTGSGNVKSWGIWRDATAPATGQERFSVALLSEEDFFASYEVTGTPASEATLPSGTATWDGEYEGVYQLGDDNGV